ncbi:MAG: hypothetical protein C4555_05230 [Dehalococcoidia bacterium]|nr:MAG: hypothetical protein C4555_05230 [Dehalococcoidia bacterium]
MALPGAPRLFSPKSLTDTLDEARSFPGACSLLRNLIPDPTTTNVFQARPAAVQITDFAGFTAPGFVSALTVIGGIAYGLIASGRNPGQDEPFAFNIAGGTFQTVGNVLAGNTPASPPTTGDWTPPTMALIGAQLIVTHPGFDGITNFFGWFDLSTPGSPVWNAGNTATTPLPRVPVAVVQFLDRAWFAVNPPNAPSATYFTDAGTLTITAGTQILTYGDNVPIVGMKVMPLRTDTGGAQHAIYVFKGTPDGTLNIWQVKGDASFTDTVPFTGGGTAATQLVSSMTKIALNVNTSTFSPNSVVASSKGLFFIAPDGLRLIGTDGTVQDPLGLGGLGVNAPFLNMLNPTRAAGAANGSILRLSITPLDTGLPREYWLDFARGVWTGPHTFPASLIASYGNSFIMTPSGVTGTLWRSDAFQTPTSTFVENGVQMTFELRTSTMSDLGKMAQFEVVETSINMSSGANEMITVTAYDERALAVGQDIYDLEGAIVAALDIDFTLDTDALDTGALAAYRPRRIDWPNALIYRRLMIGLAGNSTAFLRLGDIFIRENTLTYTQQVA